MTEKKKGKIVIRLVEKGKKRLVEVEVTGKKGKPYPLPATDYNLEDSLNGKECEVELEDGRIILRLWVDGEERQKKGTPTTKTSQKNIPSFEKKTSDTPAPQKTITNTPDNFSLANTKLPNDVRKLGFKDIDNFYLKVFKACQFVYNPKKKKEEVSLYQKNVFDKHNFLKSEITKINANYEEGIKNLFPDEKLRKTFEFEPQWRMIIGLGGESVYETSMTLHHIYGIPYIPASAIKGVTRSWIITEKFNCIEEDALKDKEFCDIFGDQNHKGKVIFFDSFPTKEPTITPDIMNPHYKDYYEAKNPNDKPPADYYKPNPIFFLTVADTPFNFMLGIKGKENKKIKDIDLQTELTDNKESTLLDVAYHWLKKALQEHGIGAKTAVGYGYMK